MFGQEINQKPNEYIGNIVPIKTSAQSGFYGSTPKSIKIENGLPIDPKIMNRSMILQWPNSNIKTHLGRLAVDLRLENNTALYAVRKGVVTIRIDSVGDGLNTYPYRDEQGYLIQNYNSDGSVYYKCDAKLDDYKNEVCGKGSYGIYAELSYEENGNKKVEKFAHLSNLTLKYLKDNINKGVGKSFQVEGGELIGFSDDSGYSSTPHTHIEELINGQAVLFSESDLNKCLKDSNQTMEKVRKSDNNNVCWEKLYNYDKANLGLMNIELDKIRN